MLLGQRLDRRSGDEYLPTFRCLGRWWQGAYDDPIRQPNLYCRKRSRGKWRRKRSRIMRGEVGEGKDEKWIWERYNNNNNNNNDQYLGMFGAMASRGRLVEVRVYNQVSCLLSILFVVWQHWSQFKKQSQMWPHVNGLGCTAAVQISHQSCTRQSKARHSEFRAGLFLTRRTELIYVVCLNYVRCVIVSVSVKPKCSSAGRHCGLPEWEDCPSAAILRTVVKQSVPVVWAGMVQSVETLTGDLINERCIGVRIPTEEGERVRAPVK